LGTKCLLVSSHSEGKVLSFKDNNWSEINIDNARGLAVNNTNVAVASHNNIQIFNRFTGKVAAILNVSSEDSHEIGLTLDNSVVACASYLSALTKHSVGHDEIIWTVPGVTNETNDARSWINGVILVDDIPKYVTVLGISDVPQGWRDEARNSRGALINTVTNEIVLHDLFFPHSPTLIGDDIWFANSGHAELCKWQPGEAKHTVVTTLPGWTRGITQLGDYVLVGISQGRLTAFPELTTDLMAQPGIAVVEVSTGNMVEFESLDVQEVFDIKITDERLQLL
jgi:hypothetical protein